MSDLLPCPFCGSPVHIAADDSNIWEVSCYDIECIAYELAWFNTEKDAIEAWNKRAGEDDE